MHISAFSRGIAATGLALSIFSMPASALEAVARSAVNVRTGPGVSFNRVDTLYGGERVNITQCQGRWCYVEHQGPNGWVSGRYLAATESGAADTGGSSGAGSGSNPGGDAAAAAILGAIIGGVLANSSHHATPPPASPPPAPATPVETLPYGPDTCKNGFVWRDAIPGDHVCVRPARRSLAAHENAIAGSRVNPSGAYGPNSCKSGFVWREAYPGDVVCVSPARRSQVHQENAEGRNHRVRP